MKKGSSKHYLVETIDDAPERPRTNMETFQIPRQDLTGKKLRTFTLYYFTEVT